MEPRKCNIKEFKLDARLVVRQGFTIAEAARSLEIRANRLGDGSGESRRILMIRHFAVMEN